MGCCMPKLVTRPPKYTLHKASGQAIVKINGKVHYMKKWGEVQLLKVAERMQKSGG